MINRQEWLNDVAAHLIKQGRRSVGFGNLCAYRGIDKSSCAIGFKIPDELYRLEFEGNAVGILLWSEPKVKSFFKVTSQKDVAFLTSLQKLHDRESNWGCDGGISAAIAKFAKRHKLSNPLASEIPIAT
jgi:hypothetical protein